MDGKGQKRSKTDLVRQLGQVKSIRTSLSRSGRVEPCWLSGSLKWVGWTWWVRQVLSLGCAGQLMLTKGHMCRQASMGWGLDVDLDTGKLTIGNVVSITKKWRWQWGRGATYDDQLGIEWWWGWWWWWWLTKSGCRPLTKVRQKERDGRVYWQQMR